MRAFCFLASVVGIPTIITELIEESWSVWICTWLDAYLPDYVWDSSDCWGAGAMLVKRIVRRLWSYVLLNRVGYHWCYKDRQAEKVRTWDMHVDECTWRKEKRIIYWRIWILTLKAAAMQAYIHFPSSSRMEHLQAVSNDWYGNLSISMAE